MRFSLLSVGLLLAVVPAAAGPHSHGEARLSLVQDGEAFVGQLDADIHDLVGPDDHGVHDHDDHARDAVRDALENGPPPIAPSEAAGCTLARTEIDGALSADAPGEAHMAVVSWHWTCQRPARLRDVTVSIGETFPRIRTIEFMTLTDGGSRTGTLGPDDRTVRLK